MQFRLSIFFWMFVVMMGALGLYFVKYKVQAVKEEVADTQERLTAEREALHVIEAEWAYLNRPQRLKALAGKYLNAEPLLGEQISELEAIPFPAPSGVEAGKSGALSKSGLTPVSMIHGDGDGE